MGSLSDYSEGKWLDHVFNLAYTPVATVYLALCTADPTDAGTGGSMSECADSGSYARTAIAWLSAASKVLTQSGAVTFPKATGSWGTVTHWAVVDNSGHGLGNMLAHGAFLAGKLVSTNNTPSIADASLNVTIGANDISTYLANKMLDLMFENVAFAKPATWLAGCTATLDHSATGTTITEPGAGAYERKQVNINGGASPTWDLKTGTTPTLVDNTHDIDFITATASWGTIVSVAVCTLATLGEILFFDNDMTDQAVGDGDTLRFPAGDLDATLV
jgi:hypothetical protein